MAQKRSNITTQEEQDHESVKRRFTSIPVRLQGMGPNEGLGPGSYWGDAPKLAVVVAKRLTAKRPDIGFEEIYQLLLKRVSGAVDYPLVKPKTLAQNIMIYAKRNPHVHPLTLLKMRGDWYRSALAMIEANVAHKAEPEDVDISGADPLYAALILPENAGTKCNYCRGS